MRRRRALTTIIMILTASNLFGGMAYANPEEARQTLAEFAQIAELLQGFSPRGEVWEGELAVGESAIIEEVLLGGNDYLIICAGDDAVLDLDLELYAASGDLIDANLLDDPRPAVGVTPPETLPVYIRVTLARADQETASFALQFLYR